MIIKKYYCALKKTDKIAKLFTAEFEIITDIVMYL